MAQKLELAELLLADTPTTAESGFNAERWDSRGLDRVAPAFVGRSSMVIDYNSSRKMPRMDRGGNL
jgi:hypothetical protein